MHEAKGRSQATCVGLLLLATLAAAAKRPAYSANEIFKNVLKAQELQVSLQCDVVREELSPEGQMSRVTGTLKVLKGGFAYLDVSAPVAQKAISDGKFLWVELSDLKQVMKYDAAKLRESGNFFLDLGSSVRYYARQSVKRLIAVGEDFQATQSSALEIRPLKADEAGFERLRVWVDHKNWLVRQVALRLSGADTKVRFLKIQRVTEQDLAQGRPAALDRRIFRYQPPPDFQVFDLVSILP